MTAAGGRIRGGRRVDHRLEGTDEVGPRRGRRGPGRVEEPVGLDGAERAAVLAGRPTRCRLRPVQRPVGPREVELREVLAEVLEPRALRPGSNAPGRGVAGPEFADPERSVVRGARPPVGDAQLVYQLAVVSVRRTRILLVPPVVVRRVDELVALRATRARPWARVRRLPAGLDA